MFLLDTLGRLAVLIGCGVRRAELVSVALCRNPAEPSHGVASFKKGFCATYILRRFLSIILSKIIVFL